MQLAFAARRVLAVLGIFAVWQVGCSAIAGPKMRVSVDLARLPEFARQRAGDSIRVDLVYVGETVNQVTTRSELMGGTTDLPRQLQAMLKRVEGTSTYEGDVPTTSWHLVSWQLYAVSIPVPDATEVDAWTRVILKSPYYRAGQGKWARQRCGDDFSRCQQYERADADGRLTLVIDTEKSSGPKSRSREFMPELVKELRIDVEVDKSANISRESPDHVETPMTAYFDALMNETGNAERDDEFREGWRKGVHAASGATFGHEKDTGLYVLRAPDRTRVPIPYSIAALPHGATPFIRVFAVDEADARMLEERIPWATRTDHPHYRDEKVIHQRLGGMRYPQVFKNQGVAEILALLTRPDRISPFGMAVIDAQRIIIVNGSMPERQPVYLVLFAWLEGQETTAKYGTMDLLPIRFIEARKRK